MMETIRLNKYLAAAGVASRRLSDTLIKSGRVAVNGTMADAFGIKIDPETDLVTLDGQRVRLPDDLVYIKLNKPAGYITTVSDPFDRPAVMDLIKGVPQRIYPVGRLDFDTEGLLLFTNDGALSNRLLHPRKMVEKEYEVVVNGQPTVESLNLLRSGVPIQDRLTSPAGVKIIRKSKKETKLSITIHEGRKRQIRHMCGYIGHPVKYLCRTRLGPISLGDLPRGAYRHLDDAEQRILLQSVGIERTP